MEAHYSLFETAYGTCGLAWTDKGLRRFQLPEAGHAATQARLLRHVDASPATTTPAWIDRLIEHVRDYFNGARVDFSDVDLDLEGQSEFHRSVYGHLHRVPWGTTTTYGDIARAVGDAGAARAVGRAMGRNPCALIVPCHRVLAAGGRAGGFSAHGGAQTKRRMLALEGVHLDGGAPALPGLFEST
jgi:methylated-DNA-[protein]-cysteine S-methyltransferase